MVPPRYVIIGRLVHQLAPLVALGKEREGSRVYVADDIIGEGEAEEEEQTTDLLM